MDLHTIALLATTGLPYGVPTEDNLPSHEERELILWTNAARVAPDAFADEYSAGGCSTDDFSEDELTAKPPLYIDVNLTDAARYHSQDMAENGCFQHESCDGTDTFERIARYYTDSGNVGENIAMGYPDVRNVVLSGWMCSHDGHRANIMSGGYNEMGAGVERTWYTQDFGAGNLAEGNPPVRVAIDSFTGGYYADWEDSDAPVALSIVMDGIETPMALEWGDEDQGVFFVEEPEEGPATCHEWYTWWETEDGETGTFPAQGSWQVGDCAESETGWIDHQYQKGGLFGDVPEDRLEDVMVADIELMSCAVAPASPAWLLTGLAAFGLRRRR